MKIVYKHVEVELTYCDVGYVGRIEGFGGFSVRVEEDNVEELTERVHNLIDHFGLGLYSHEEVWDNAEEDTE
jgi:hypothetical protein